jgi:hypothetical protein
MPGPITKDITKNIDTIQDLQEEISKWSTALAGVHVGSDFEELFMHLSGLGHLEVLKLASLKNYDPKSAKVQFENKVKALNLKMCGLHKNALQAILMKNTLPEQIAGVKKYAAANKGAVDDFVKQTDVKDVNHLPANVQTAYKKVQGLA